eukprot:scaffold187559_cov30-Tisochrysis_lutea.AAC.2
MDTSDGQNDHTIGNVVLLRIAIPAHHESRDTKVWIGTCTFSLRASRLAGRTIFRKDGCRLAPGTQEKSRQERAR